jgi:sugar/nucleoside kinase (ribokinase family)
VAIDTIIEKSATPQRTALGGPVAYCSTALRTFGCDFDVITSIGKDFPKEYSNFLLENAGIKLDPFVSPTYPTTRFRIDRSKEPRRMWLEAKCESLDMRLFRRSEEMTSDSILLADPIAGEISPYFLKNASRNFKKVLLDAQGFARSFDPLSGEVEMKSSTANLDWLDDVDYLKGDIDEIRALSGTTDFPIREIGKHVKHIILTSGSGPVEIFEADSLLYRARPFDIVERDTTGAGDILLAIFAGSVAEGLKDREALQIAVAAATISVSKAGIGKAILERTAIEKAARNIVVESY